MKRRVMLLIVLLLVSLGVYADYKIALTDGTVIKADDKPVLKGDLAYFSKDGLFLFISKSRVDFAKTDEINMKAVLKEQIIIDQGEQGPAPVAVTPVFIDDSQLDIIRQRSRLANEGEFAPPPPPPGLVEEGAEGGEGAPSASQPAEGPSAAAGQESARAALQSQLQDLLTQRASVQSQRDQLQARLSDLNDQFGFSVQQDQKQALQAQIDSVQEQIGGLNGQLDGINNDVLDTQSRIAATPLTVEVK